jgi:ribosomal protein S18 acetylase RimI-like enzyme
VTTQRFHIKPLSAHHDRAGFCCGNDRIDRYFREIVSQDIKRNYTNCFVAAELGTERVAGFYTLTANAIPLADIPDDLKKKLPRYPTVPAALIGWLGRHVDFKGCHLGEALLYDAIRLIATSKMAAHAIIVDAIDAKAIEFYASYGFVSLAADRPGRMYLPVATALKVIEG